MNIARLSIRLSSRGLKRFKVKKGAVMNQSSRDRNENGSAKGKSVETEKTLAPSRRLRGAKPQTGGSAMNQIKNSLVAFGGLSLLFV